MFRKHGKYKKIFQIKVIRFEGGYKRIIIGLTLGVLLRSDQSHFEIFRRDPPSPIFITHFLVTYLERFTFSKFFLLFIIKFIFF